MPPQKPPKSGHAQAEPTPENPSSVETLAAASARMVMPQRPGPTLFRVVEVALDADGRIARRGKIWHTDLSMVRRFGRALAANSDAQKVEVADARGKIIETLVAPPSGSQQAGWAGWRTIPLPPAPPPASAGRVTRRAPLPPPVLPLPLEPESEVETTRTL